MGRQKLTYRKFEFTKALLASANCFTPNITAIANKNDYSKAKKQALMIFWRKHANRFKITVRIELDRPEDEAALNNYYAKQKENLIEAEHNGFI